MRGAGPGRPVGDCKSVASTQMQGLFFGAFVTATLLGCGSDLDSADRNAAADEADTYSRPEATATIIGRDWSTQPGAADRMARFGLTALAIADLRSAGGSEADGAVRFRPSEDASHMVVDIELVGLEAGDHAIHVHAVGDCSAEDASSAGGHFAPYGAPHGNPGDTTRRPVGVLGNVHAGADGRVTATLTSQSLAFSGPASVLQKAVFVHRTSATENSVHGDADGDRVACGVIRAETEALVGAMSEGQRNSTRVRTAPSASLTALEEVVQSYNIGLEWPNRRVIAEPEAGP